MAIIYDFQKAHDQKFNPEPYIAPPLIEHVPEDIQGTLQINNAEMLRRKLKIADTVIKSVDIPLSRELAEHEQPPKFEYLPNQEK